MTLGKIIKIVATRCKILRLKCTKFNFGWGSAPDPAGGAHSAPPDFLTGLRGPTSKGRGGDRKGRAGKGRGEGKGGDGKGRESPREERGRDPTPSRPPNPYFWIRPCGGVLEFTLSLYYSECITIGYDSVYLTYSKKADGSQLSLPHETRKLTIKTKKKAGSPNVREGNRWLLMSLFSANAVVTENLAKY